MNGEFAHQLFHTDQAVGRYFKDGSGRLIQIIGVVEDGKYESLSEEPRPAAFFPIGQQRNTATVLVVRTRMDTNEMAATVRKVVHDLDPGVPIQDLGVWRKQLALQLFPARAATIALSLFGIFGLLLSITGTFGLASYTVTKRLRELSIRVALGAHTRQVISAALGRMITLVTAGLVAGLMLGIGAGNLLSAIFPCLCTRSVGIVGGYGNDAVHRITLNSKSGPTCVAYRSGPSFARRVTPFLRGCYFGVRENI